MSGESARGVASQPSRQPVINQAFEKLLALINAPATQLLRTIQEPGAQIVRLLESLRKTKGE